MTTKFVYNALAGQFDLVTDEASVGDVTGPASSITNDIVIFADTTGKVIADSGRQFTDFLLASNNLSDLTNTTTARSNLGLGTSATHATGDFLQTANNLSDLPSPSTGRTNLGLGTAATQASTFFAQVANNLSDLTSASTARTNLGLGTAATQSTGTFLQVANNLIDLNNASTARTNLGLGTSATHASTDYLLVANNLSDVNSTSSSRTNLGVAIGTNVQAYSAQLDSIAGIGNGIIAHTAANTFTARTFQVGSTKLAVTNGTGVSGDPSYDVQEANLTISNMAGTLATTHGGTGLTSYTTGDVIHASASNTLAALAISTQPGMPLTTSGTDTAWFNPATDMLIIDDLLSGTAAIGNTGYKTNTQNSAGTSQTGASGHPGVIQLGTGAQTTGAINLSHGNTLTTTDGRILLKFVCKLSGLSDATDTYTARIGLGTDSTATADFTDGAYFEYTHSVNSGNWTIKTANNSSRTTANTNTAADTNWHLFAVDMNAAGTSVNFYIDGVEVANSPIATNLPAVTRFFSDAYRITKSAGTTERRIDLDLTILWKKITSARY